MKALKQPGAPKAGPARYLLDIAILLKIRIPDIITECEAAVKAEGEFIPEHALPERAGPIVVPDVKDVLIAHVAEGPWLDPLFNAADIASIPMPEEVTGMHVTIPRDEGAVSFDELALPRIPRRHARQGQFHSRFPGNVPGLI